MIAPLVRRNLAQLNSDNVMTAPVRIIFAMLVFACTTHPATTKDIGQYKVKNKGSLVRVQDKSKPVRAALEEQYRKAAQAYFDDDPEAILALRTADFTAQLPNGQSWSGEESAAYVRASFDQVERTLHVSFEIQALTVRDATAVATIHQRWERVQEKAGRYVDGKRVDPREPYDPDAPAYDPDAP